MKELRLVPCALAVWVMTIAVTFGVEVWCLGAIGLAVVVLWIRGRRGQAVLIGGVSVVSLVVAATRRARARAFEFVGEVSARVLSRPTATEHGGWFVRVRPDGFPTDIPLFLDSPPDGTDIQHLGVGAVLTGRFRASPAERPSIAGVVLNGRTVDIHPPAGAYAWANTIAANFREAVERWVGEASQGLYPAMVLGDISLQDEVEKQLYIDTGLSHLSAVSGANITIVTSVAVVIAAFFACGPRGQFLAAFAALAGYVFLVGPEPSVLRAAVTGVAGLCAVVGSARMEPIHALSLAVMGLVLWRGELAVNFGFALSVAATAGIVALSPFLIRSLARTRLPHVIVRALAVAIAADIVTLPLVALMTGEVSVVSVVANVLVAAAAAPVTLVGLIAAVLAQCPAPFSALAVIPLKIVEPCTWWIHTIAVWCHRLPVDKVAATPFAVAVAYGWVVAGFAYGRPRLTIAATVVAVAVVAGDGAVVPWRAPTNHGEEVELSADNTVVVQEESDIGTADIGPNVKAIIVRGGKGKEPHDRPTVTRDAVPVIYPDRDGKVVVLTDGSQKATNGAFRRRLKPAERGATR